jgi:hypothetical protein
MCLCLLGRPVIVQIHVIDHPFNSGIAVIVLLTLWKFVHYKVSGVAGFRSSRLITSFYRDGVSKWQKTLGSSCLFYSGIMFYVAMLGEAFTSLEFIFSPVVVCSHFHWHCGNPVAKQALWSDRVQITRAHVGVVGFQWKHVVDRPDSPLRVMHSILVCQLVIHVRAIASDEDPGTVGKSKSLLFANLQTDNRCGVDTVI